METRLLMHGTPEEREFANEGIHRGHTPRSVSSFTRDVTMAVLFLFSLASAAFPQTYPPGPQIKKDGTVVWLTNYASLPLSGRGGSLSNFSPPPVLTNQLGRVNFLRAEPEGTP